MFGSFITIIIGISVTAAAAHNIVDRVSPTGLHRTRLRLLDEEMNDLDTRLAARKAA